MKLLKTCFPLLLVFTAAACTHGLSAERAHRFEPAGLLLTWQRDPTTTMTIDWHTLKETPSELQYREAGTDTWAAVTGASHPFPFTERTIHRVELTGLDPNTTYEFRFGPDSREYRFRTMPADLREPVRFAAGGDTRHQKNWMERTNRIAMKYDPCFVVWGGDLAYANGDPKNVSRWFEWFEAIHDTLIARDGRVVPVVAGVGNHEVQQGSYRNHEDREDSDAFRERIAPFFYALLAFPGQPGYDVLDFGDYMSLIILDTDHLNPIEGAQTEWLARTLEERAGRPHVFPVYHVTAYPSNRDFNGRVETSIRELWTPLFDRHGVKLAFEHHDHTYKRTYPIRAGEVHEDGVVYIGDGAWGVRTRPVHPVDETWYLRRAESARHCIIVTLQGTARSVLVVDEHGDVIDTYPEMPFLHD